MRSTNAAAWMGPCLHFAEGFGFCPTVEVLMPRPRVLATGKDTIRRGKAPDLAWGSLFEQAMLLCLESSPGMPRDTLARVAHDSVEVPSRMARPKNLLARPPMPIKL